MLDGFFSLKCPDCGGKIDENQRYCPHCGVDLDAALSRTDPNAMSATSEYLGRAQQIYDKGGDLSKALMNCELALQYNPDLADAHNLRGLILDAMERTDEAIKAYREALRLNPNLDDARANLRDAEAELIHRPVQPFQPQFVEPGFTASENSLWPTILKAGIGIFVAVLILACGGALFFFGRDYLWSPTTLILEPDVPPGSEVSKSDLETTARILTERSRALGYSQVTFAISKDNRIIGQIPSHLDAQTLFDQISSIGLLEFVDFGTTPPSDGEIIRTDRDHPYLPVAEGTLWHTVMTNSGIESAEALPSQFQQDERYDVAFSLTDEGAQIFSEHTAQNINTYLGIVLDKTIISSPLINGPIPDGLGMITGNFTEAEAQELAAILQTRPLPIPVRLKE